ncbi:LuxR C-terminal-related transcriptional regulator [Hyphococcus luteus]|uniref:HTH luxR-type domain-containing protein n=1 Tax=Hyphococcus luteus TaxID=2058213 RepID=A0A2S7K0Q7_9PROT|nr:LuxR C-terminal-related transcriptional regulator [Marinicaulis flavus]PQA86008.1 hypothetical protein CW354_16645 [Marinicaulis flavus]
MNTNWIIETKLCPPQLWRDLIVRRRLDGEFLRWRQSKLGLIIAPAGYGKTSLLAEWCERWSQEGAHVAWLSLDDNDSELLRLMSYLIAAISNAGVRLGRLEMAARQGLADTLTDAAFASLINQLAECKQDVVVVLDDYHRVQSAEADKLLDAFIASAPDHVHVFISGRERPKIIHATYRARDQLIEVGSDALKFTDTEARDLLGPAISAAVLDGLIHQTEGWAVALQLAKLWCEDRHDAAAPKAADLLWSGNVADYFAEQILFELEPSLQEFLLKTSILERFNADLANSICGRGDCGQILSSLHKLHALIFPLDRDQCWFRCHHLFSDFLKRTLEKERPQSIPTLHGAASEWFEKEGFLVEAVEHAKAAGDTVRAAGVVLSAGGWRLIIEYGVGIASSLLQQFTAEEVRRFPRLQICQAYHCMKTGDIARAHRLLEELEPLRAHGGREADAATLRDYEHVSGLLHRYEDLPMNFAELARTREKLKSADENDPGDLAVRLTEACLQPLVLGDIEPAQAASSEAIRRLQASGQVLPLNYCYFHLGLAQYHALNLNEAEATISEARALAEENYGSDSGLKNIADGLLGVMRAERDDMGAAENFLSSSLSYIERHDSWLEIFAPVYQASASVAYCAEGHEAVLAVLARGEMTAQRRNLDRLQTLMLAERGRWLAYFGALAEAGAVLSDDRLAFSVGAWREDPFQWRRHHAVGMARLCLQLAERRPDGAREIIDDLEAAAERGGRAYDAAQARIFRALFSYAAKDEINGAAQLLKVLSIAAPQNARRLFLEMPLEIEDLLRVCRQQSKLRASGSFLRSFIEDLLEAGRLRRMRLKTHKRLDLLSAREREVMSELSNGARNKEIARVLDMTENTVKFHLKNIFAKLGVENRAEAVAVARERSLTA